jgi:hypothetical protein
MQDEEKAAVGSAMDRLPRDHDVAELQVAEAPQVLVVIAGDQRDDGASPGFGENRANDVGVDLRPVRSASQLPEVPDIADEVQVVALLRAQCASGTTGLGH